MDKYGLVNLERSQYRDRRILRYALKNMFDYFDVIEMHKSWRYDYYSIARPFCNNSIQNDLLKENRPSYCTELVQYIDENKALGDYAGYIEHHLERNFSYPFLRFYKGFHSLSESAAVYTLLKIMGCNLPDWMPDYNDDTGFHRVEGILEMDSLHIDYDYQYVLQYDGAKPQWDIHNSKLIKDVNRTVFLVDEKRNGKKIERDYNYRFYKYFINKIGNMLNVFDDQENESFNSNTPKATVRQILKSIESLAITDRLKENYTNVFWSYWNGGYYTLNNTDWTPLEDREVFFFQFKVDKATALKNFVTISRFIPGDIAKNLSLVWIEKKDDILPYFDANMDELNRTSFGVYSCLETFKEAYDLDINLDERQQEIVAQHIRNKKKLRRNQGSYLIKPIIRKDSISIISGIPGSGKSWIAMILGAAMATRGKLFGTWEVKKKAKVIYVADDEMDKEILFERQAILQKLYRNYSKNFVFESVHRINLLLPEDRHELEMKINQHFLNLGVKGKDDFCVVILDHLNKLTDSEGDQKKYWTEFRAWLEDLNSKKITVIVVHHEAQGRTVGTVKIEQDIDVHIHVEQSDDTVKEHQLKFDYTVPKNKAAKDQRKPRSVILELGRKVRLIENNQQELKDLAYWKSLSFEERCAKIKELRPHKTMQEIAEELGCHKPTLEKFCQSAKIGRKYENISTPDKS